MIAISEIIRIEVESYVDTLRQIEVGETRYFRLVGTVYTGFHNAKTRLSKKDFEFVFQRIKENDEHYLKVERIK